MIICLLKQLLIGEDKMVYISYNCVDNKAYLLEHDDELITEIITEKEMSFAEAVRLALKLGINRVEDDDLTEVFLKYHEDADNFRANQSGFDAMYEILSKYGDPDEYVDEVFKRAPREEQLKMVSLITPRNMDESLKEDFSDARPAATKIFNFIEMGADPAAILDELLRFLPDSALVDFADYYGENFLGIGDDWE